MNNPVNRNKKPKGFLFWIFAFTVMLFVVNMLFNLSTQNTVKIKFSEFLEKVENNNILTAHISKNTITGEIKPLYEGEPVQKYETVIPVEYPDLVNKLQEKNVQISGEKVDKNQWLSVLLSTAPFLILIVLWIAMIKQQSGGKTFNFGKTKAKMFTGEKKDTTFKDVAGVEEAKDELQEVIEFLKSPKRFQRLGGKIPKGVLLIGPPGSGKTLLAKAIAGEANVPFFSISGSEFVELFVGVGASRVRDLFEQGKKHAPCLIFIDEIDAVGRQRGAGLGGGHDEREQTLNQLLVEMDGFNANEGVIIIAATNRPDILDTALLRPGRFDRRIIVSSPDVKGREEILKVHTRKIPLARNVDLKVLARSTPGFSGADIANLVNEAALYASRRDNKSVEMSDFEYAKDKVLMGRERRSMIISEQEKKLTAYHEAGHALVAYLKEEADPLHKVSIIPRGMALGVTQQLPVDDKHTYSKDYLEAQICVFMAGRLSEELFLKQVTTGAGNDFEKATSIARKMVCEWGMSKLGPVNFSSQNDMIFLGKELGHHVKYSEDTAQRIDTEVNAIIIKAYNEVKELLTRHKKQLKAIANSLLEKESLNSNEIKDIMKGVAGLRNRDNPGKKSR